MINFVIGPNGVGKTTFLKKMKENNDILLEVNQKIEDLTSDTKSSFLVQVLSKIEEAKISNIKSNIESEFNDVSHSISYFNKTKVINFNNNFDLKTITDSSELKKESAGEQAMIALNLIKDNASVFEGNKILIDEIDAFLNPSAFNEVKLALDTIENLGIEIWIVTHNPNLLSLWNIVDNNLNKTINIYYFKEYQSPENIIPIIDDYLVEWSDIIDEIIFLGEPTSFANVNSERRFMILYNKVNRDDSSRSVLLNFLFKNVWAKILVEREVTLVEGYSEYFYFQANPQENQTNLVVTFSKYWMTPTITLCNKLEIGLFTIFDKDNDTDLTRIHNKLNARIEELSPTNFKLIDDLESQFSITKIYGDKILDIIDDILT